MNNNRSIFEFDWEESQGLDIHLVEWEYRALKDELNPLVLEISPALYSAFIELRKIRRIMSEGRPGEVHSFYQYRFELFAHNHFLSIAATCVIKILQIGWPNMTTNVMDRFRPLIERIAKYRNSLEHQTEIGRQKLPSTFFNNLDSNGFVSEGIVVAYSEVEELLNYVMRQVESIVQNPFTAA